MLVSGSIFVSDLLQELLRLAICTPPKDLNVNFEEMVAKINTCGLNNPTQNSSMMADIPSKGVFIY